MFKSKFVPRDLSNPNSPAHLSEDFAQRLAAAANELDTSSSNLPIMLNEPNGTLLLVYDTRNPDTPETVSEALNPLLALVNAARSRGMASTIIGAAGGSPLAALESLVQQTPLTELPRDEDFLRNTPDEEFKGYVSLVSAHCFLRESSALEYLRTAPRSVVLRARSFMEKDLNEHLLVCESDCPKHKLLTAGIRCCTRVLEAS